MLMEIKASKPEEPNVPELLDVPLWAVRAITVNEGKAGKPYPKTYIQVGTYVPPFGPNYHHPNNNVRTILDGRKRHRAEIGNLSEGDYRFWNGSSCFNSELAVCRWCRKYCYGQKEMEEHKKAYKHTVLLRKVFDFARALKNRQCFVCGDNTRHDKWGIPMCNKDSCQNKWRIGPIAELGKYLAIYAKGVGEEMPRDPFGR